MRPQEIIARKRDGGELSAEEVRAFIDGVCDQSWADYQISALLMAMFTRGLSLAEQDALTHAMLYSGQVLDFSQIEAPKVDKHSTGGVGDKTSLIIAPLLAACGVAVPMISGRGLGHTGGTLDKLESISGYDVRCPVEQFRFILKKCGFAMAGQTAEIAPADRKLYAMRDATATVPYIPLIVASIMSKKLAEGLDALILDVKTGNGAFMQSIEDSRRLAEALVQTGRNFGVKTEAVVSDMSEPLGKYIGNAVEVYECIKIMRGETEPEALQTRSLSIELAARALVLAGVSENIEAARLLCDDKLTGGDALERFRLNCELQGGDPAVCDDPERLLDSTLEIIEIHADSEGFIAEADALKIGEAVVAIGGGRIKAEDRIDHEVGYSCEAKAGDEVRRGQVLGKLFCRSAEQADLIGEKLRAAYKICETPPPHGHLIHAVV